MNFVLLFSAITVLIAISTLVILLYFLRKKPVPEDNTAALFLQRQIEGLNTQLNEQLGRMGDQLGKRLEENASAIYKTNQAVGERLDNAARAYTSVTSKLSQLEEANKRIEDIGKDISSLQDIFRSPKLRGGIGEHFLADLLAQILPAGQYELQHTFKSGERVDAVIRLRDGLLVPIDSKFPLEHLTQSIEAQDASEQERLRKAFISGVKKHIDKISKLYILPEEGTLPMALMYVPAENVYYETIIRGGDGDKNVVEYAHERRVIPVSPNSFYIYLQTILLGLRGMQVEERAQEILKHLGQLRGDFERFDENYRVLGKHLGSASKTYQVGEKKLEKFGGRLEIGNNQKNSLYLSSELETPRGSNEAKNAVVDADENEQIGADF